MTKYQNLNAVLLLLGLIFLFYIVWDILLIIQFGEDRIKIIDSNWFWTFKGEWVTLLLFILITILYLVHNRFSNLTSVTVGIVLIIAYRILKIWPSDNPKQKTRLKIYIAGPYTADTEEGLISNTMASIDAGLKLYFKGHFPFIAHLTHWVDQRAKETDVPIQWHDYINWDSAWLEECDALVYIGKSKGADLELKKAKSLGLKIFYSVEDVPTVDMIYEDEVLKNELGANA